MAPTPSQKSFKTPTETSQSRHRLNFTNPKTSTNPLSATPTEDPVEVICRIRDISDRKDKSSSSSSSALEVSGDGCSLLVRSNVGANNVRPYRGCDHVWVPLRSRGSCKGRTMFGLRRAAPCLVDERTLDLRIELKKAEEILHQQQQQLYFLRKQLEGMKFTSAANEDALRLHNRGDGGKFLKQLAEMCFEDQGIEKSMELEMVISNLFMIL